MARTNSKLPATSEMLATAIQIQNWHVGKLANCEEAVDQDTMLMATTVNETAKIIGEDHRRWMSIF
jgi:hypothetical protein